MEVAFARHHRKLRLTKIQFTELHLDDNQVSLKKHSKVNLQMLQ